MSFRTYDDYLDNLERERFVKLKDELDVEEWDITIEELEAIKADREREILELKEMHD